MFWRSCLHVLPRYRTRFLRSEPVSARSISAGFMLASAVGRSTRFLAVGLALFFFGDQIRELLEDYSAPIAVAFLVILALGVFLMRWISDRATAAV